MTNNLKLQTHRVVQNNQEFLLGVFKIADILRFTRYTEFTILGFDEENDNIPITKKEVQRKLIPSKVKSIVNFLLHDPLAIFPTNLVIAIPNHVITAQIENSENGMIDLYLDEKITKEIENIDKFSNGQIYLSVIDGQHRIKGIEETINFLKKSIITNEKLIRSTDDSQKFDDNISKLKSKLEEIEKIELPVTFFVDPVLEYQAMIFSTINRTQTKVPPDLVYSLFGLTKDDSPQKTVLNIVNTLNGRKDSPFYKRIKLAGSSTKAAKDFYYGGNPVLSQATVVREILKWICKNNQELEIARHKKRNYFSKNSDRTLPFRKYYAKDEDERIIKILYSYFTAVRKTFTSMTGNSLWNFDEENSRVPENILQTTIGFVVLLDLLKILLREIPEEKNFDISVYSEYLQKAMVIDFDDSKNKIPKYPFANKTKSILLQDLKQAIFG